MNWAEGTSTAHIKQWTATGDDIHRCRCFIYLLHGHYFWFVKSNDEKWLWAYGDTDDLTQAEDEVKHALRSMK